jgi:hypothetical protein
MAIKWGRFRKLMEVEDILARPGIYNGFAGRLLKQNGIKSVSKSRTAQ